MDPNCRQQSFLKINHYEYCGENFSVKTGALNRWLPSLKTRCRFVIMRYNAEQVKDGLHTEILHYFLHMYG